MNSGLVASASAGPMPLYSESSGRGAPLVFWHGWASNLRVFDALRAALAEQWRTTAIDLPGHGRSPWEGGAATPDAELLAEQTVARLLDAMPPRATLIAWSLGGQLALRAAVRVPDRIERLVLIGTTPKFLRSDDWPHGASSATLEQMRARLAEDYRGAISDFLELQVRGSRDAAAVHAALRGMLLAHGEAQAPALQAGLAMLASTDLRTQLASIHIPALVIAGQYDRVTAPAASAALAKMLPQAQFLEVPRAAHAAFLSHPERLLPQLRAFLGAACVPGPTP
ncbi:MAG TPA: alpha/beta fold hydrolase [Steroidobacteraceae bacterium]